MNAPLLPDRFLRAARRFFSGPLPPPRPVADPGDRSGLSVGAAAGGLGGPGGPCARQRARFGSAQGTVRAFYAFGFLLVALRVPEFGPGRVPPASLLLWPVAWVAWTPRPDLAPLAIQFALLGGSLAAVFWASARWARAWSALGWLEYVALENSSVKIGHSLHLLVVVSALLVALPTGWARPAARTGRALRQRTLLTVWACQAALLLIYSLSGLGKVGGICYQLARGQAHALGAESLARHVAERLLQTDSSSLLGDWLVAHPWAGGPLLPLTIYLQFFAFAVAFRPSLHRWWALGLIGFHLAVSLFMTINFAQNCFLLALFLVAYPAEPAPDWRRALGDLPLFGWGWRRLLLATRAGTRGPAAIPGVPPRSPVRPPAAAAGPLLATAAAAAAAAAPDQEAEERLTTPDPGRRPPGVAAGAGARTPAPPAGVTAAS